MISLVIVPWLIIGCGCPRQAGAQPPGKQAEPKVNVTVVVIMASTTCKCIDPRLKEVAAQLQKKDPKMTGFSVVRIMENALAANEKGTFTCFDDAKTEVVIRRCVDKDGKVMLSVTAPLQEELVYDTICGKYFPIITRYQAKETIPPTWMAQALAQALSQRPLGSVMAVDTLLGGRCQPRLIVAVSVQPCLAK